MKSRNNFGPMLSVPVLSALVLFVLGPFLMYAQIDNPTYSNYCLSDQLHKKMLNENEGYNKEHKALEHQIYNLKPESSLSARSFMTTETIPVVVHVIHQNGSENISNDQVFDAIQHLNDAFKNIGIYDPNTGVDIEIEFCLAKRDPENELSNGVNRIESPLTNVVVETQDLELKSLLQWDPLSYVNIWVVNEINSSSAGPGILGYANLPAAHGLPEDGVVIEANFFGTSEDNSKVLVHELGHYLGLYHTFEGGCSNGDCQLDGDRICDTPPDQSTAPVDCAAAINTCDSDEDDTSSNNPFRPVSLGGLGDQNDMFINYMDYGNPSCFTAFTQGQKERMNIVLSTARQSLLESLGCQSLCPFSSYDASFVSDESSTVFVGDLIEFTNSSDAANFYEWSIDDQVISNTSNLSHAFLEEGIFTVTLLIRDTKNKCESSFQKTFDVICQGEASFTSQSFEILIGETLDFTNTSTPNNISYQWFLDGALHSSDTDLSITFTEAGFYSLFLVGSTANCLNYSTTSTIMVGSCLDGDRSEMNWYFGRRAAMDFNDGEPVLVSESPLVSNEGTACISDDDGNLLFYTDGITIWDATNQVMSNGTGLMGGATSSSRDQALIIPRPFHPLQYYVFTCDELENYSENGIRYSVVDMTLNGGLGGVTNEKNIFLSATNRETLNAAFHQDKEKAWLVIPDHNVLNTYLIDSMGISLANSFADANYNSDWNFTRFSNSGKKIVLNQIDLNTKHLVMLDFDNSNGVFSNPIEIHTGYSGNRFFEFSSNDSKLYHTIDVAANEFKLFQFDLSLTTSAAISNSQTLISEISGQQRILLAPNGKIYLAEANNSYLGVINHPNLVGIECDYESRAIDLSPASNTASFPKFIRGQRIDAELLSPNIDLGADQNNCVGFTSVLNPSDEEYDFVWQDGSTNSTFTAWLPGTYWVAATNRCGTVIDSITITLADVELSELGDDVKLCQGRDLILDPGSAGDYFFWQDGSSEPTLKVTETGIYWVQVSNQDGCFDIDTISVTLDTEAPLVDCPADIDTIVPPGTNELLINPGIPFVIDDCNYIIVNDKTNTNSALGFYPTSTTTTVNWTIIDENGNRSTCSHDVMVNMATGTSDLYTQSSTLIVYPNPSNGHFYIEDSENDIDEIQLKLFDQLGRIIFQQSKLLNGNMPIDLADQAEGVYYLQWSTDEKGGVLKLINQL